jgi:ketosteroid isomerase-like protein
LRPAGASRAFPKLNPGVASGRNGVAITLICYARRARTRGEFQVGLSFRFPALMLVALACSGAAHADEDVSALLQRQTQAFSDAGKTGDAAVMEKYLAPDVVFFNETGEQATKKDIVDGATPPPAGAPRQTITTTDWNCVVHGDVAVASFVDVLDQTVGGKPVRLRFRSVETWLKQDGGWKMIGSETLTLQGDPAAVAVDAKTLDDYAGSYSAGPGLTMTFTRKGDELLAALNGGAQTVQKLEARDIAFTPGRGSARKVFQRDDHGRITGFAYLRPGSDLFFKRVG